MATNPKKPRTVFDAHPWGLSTRPGPPPEPPAENGPRRPFAAGAYQGQPFGPYPASPNQTELGTSRVVRLIDPAAELRFSGEWRTVTRRDLPEDLSWGRVVVAISSVAGTDAGTLDELPYVEVRILQWTNGIAEIVLEAAAGQRADRRPSGSPGPVSFEWDVGEIPDAYEVQARARRGAGADNSGVSESGDDGEMLSVTVTGRFHR